MPLRPTVIDPVDEDVEINWKKLDYTGAFTGDYHGSLAQLRAHLQDGGSLNRPLYDVSDVKECPKTKVYLCDPQELVICTVVTLLTPWGEDRYIPRLTRW